MINTGVASKPIGRSLANGDRDRNRMALARNLERVRSRAAHHDCAIEKRMAIGALTDRNDRPRPDVSMTDGTQSLDRLVQNAPAAEMRRSAGWVPGRRQW